MSNIHQFQSPNRVPDAVDNAGIHALYLAAELTPGQLRALLKLGFEEYENNVLAIRPKTITHEQCQDILNTTRRPLVAVDTETTYGWEAIEEWLEK